MRLYLMLVFGVLVDKFTIPTPNKLILFLFIVAGLAAIIQDYKELTRKCN